MVLLIWRLIAVQNGAKAKASGAESASPIIARTPAMRRTLDNIEALGLTSNMAGLIEKAAIVRRVEKQAKRKVDPDTAQPEDFHGMQYQPYLLFDDPVFSEILLEPKPLALITYLLGESCILSSMGCHFRGPGGLPLGVHADGVRENCKTPSSLVANCNYALTPYTQEAGAVVLFPGSHRRLRQPTPHENWMAGGKTILDGRAQAKAKASGAESASPIVTLPEPRRWRRTLDNIEATRATLSSGTATPGMAAGAVNFPVRESTSLPISAATSCPHRNYAEMSVTRKCLSVMQTNRGSRSYSARMYTTAGAKRVPIVPGVKPNTADRSPALTRPPILVPYGSVGRSVNLSVRQNGR